LIVEVTLEPSATAPRNSVKHARIPACHIFSVRAATDVAYELATSLAPLEADEKTKAIVVRARIQLYFWRAGAMIGECSGRRGEEVRRWFNPVSPAELDTLYDKILVGPKKERYWCRQK
jgi:hypothetical protein